RYAIWRAMATTIPRLCSLRHSAASPACSSTSWSMTPSRPKWAASSTRLHCRPAFREGKEDDESRGHALAFLSQTHDFVETRFFSVLVHRARCAGGKTDEGQPWVSSSSSTTK